jgi:hypothetical protein
MLSEARKYNLQLVLAHQFTSQLSSKVADAIFGNVDSMVFFRVGVDDATYLHKAVSSVFTAEDLQNLATGEAVMRAWRAEHTFNLKTYPPPAKPATNFASALIAHSRQHYSIPIKEAEERLRVQYQKKAEAKAQATSAPPKALGHAISTWPSAGIKKLLNDDLSRMHDPKFRSDPRVAREQFERALSRLQVRGTQPPQPGHP